MLMAKLAWMRGEIAKLCLSNRCCFEISDEKIQSFSATPMDASRRLSSGAYSRDPLARNDDNKAKFTKVSYFDISGNTVDNMAPF